MQIRPKLVITCVYSIESIQVSLCLVAFGTNITEMFSHLLSPMNHLDMVGHTAFLNVFPTQVALSLLVSLLFFQIYSIVDFDITLVAIQYCMILIFVIFQLFFSWKYLVTIGTVI